MPTGTVMPFPKFFAWNDDGTPMVGGMLYAYRAGTLTPIDTFLDSDEVTPNSNPVVLDARGEAIVYLTETSYDFWLEDADGNPVWGPITTSSTALGQASGVGEIYMFGGSRVFAIADLTYPVGASYDKLLMDSVPWEVDSANLPGTYALEVTLMSADGIVTVTAALVNLSDGAPDTPMVTCVSLSATGAKITSGDIVFPAGGTDKLYAVKVKVSGAAGGYAWGARIVRVS